MFYSIIVVAGHIQHFDTYQAATTSMATKKEKENVFKQA